MNIDIRAISKKHNITQKLTREVFKLASSKNWADMKKIQG